VDEACRIAREMGCTRTVKLKVSGAFHSPLMQPAREKLARRLASVSIRPPRAPVVSNVTARPAGSPDEIRQLLARQVTESVLWSDAMAWMWSQGITDYWEIGPGKVLTGLMRRIQRDANLRNIDGADTLEKEDES